ncbi:hypothetical protein SAMN04487895_103354 [Paenibacillus sophorae]|uniref:Uncharacterized protein n=1 Tax=Paenibacillus sophorae TaxID=1333845 RepID=A0A1H8KAA6_9BACL|nr:hypothetical protein [Paenibacillus sophorae]QWU13667.1 hypothetical protein KP014_16935 [Paenibacillus sophorae]SEN89775.1 hypothetical protein SAMN04487895_103354 [Paenibacillus sophorae]
MMKDPHSSEVERVEVDEQDVDPIYENRVKAANAVKYTAYIMLFLGFLYFLVAFILPMFE